MFFFDLIKQLFFIALIMLVTPPLLRLLKQEYLPFIEARSQVAIVPLEGTLTSAAPTIALLNDLFENNAIKAILLIINTAQVPLATAEAIYTEVESLKRHHPKPVIGFIENNGTQGSYWIACAADYLIAPGTATIGGISGSFNQTASSDDEQMKELVADRYQQFSYAVARSRKLSIAKMEQWGNSKIFTGQQAQKVHLIDAIGSMQLAKSITKQRGLLEGQIEWITNLKFSEQLFSNLNIVT